ncbi:MAG: tetratricopeptide repeat protein [Anaerolineales bacterium]|nr:tetratricopeptide repeat protein [Anaerolineales bacterium]
MPTQTASILGRLPLSPSVLVGRINELQAVEDSLRKDRVVTICGSAGSGKTRLALEIAHQMIGLYQGNCWWVNLNLVTEERLLPQVVLDAFGIHSEGGFSMHLIRGVLANSSGLIVFDNAEHLVAPLAEFVYDLQRYCPELRILLTSLIPLGLPFEKVIRINPLAVPLGDNTPIEDLIQCESVALFCQRAQRIAFDFSLTEANAPAIASICRRLEGLPLSIELAASLVPVLSVSQIDQQLSRGIDLLHRSLRFQEDLLPERHQDIRAVLEWGYGLCSEGEQDLLQFLSVLNGDFSLELVLAIYSPNTGPEKIIDLLLSLIDKSMIVRVSYPDDPNASYRLLEIIRQFAKQKLAESGRAEEVQQRYLEWAVHTAEHYENQLLGQGAGEAVRAIDNLVDHFRGTLRWAINSQHLILGMRLVNALFRYWFMHGSLQEGHTWAEEIFRLAESDQNVPDAIKAKTAYVIGRIACRQGDSFVGKHWGEVSLRLAQSATNPNLEAIALDLLGLVADDLGEVEKSLQYHQAALAIRREQPDRYPIAVSLNNLGLLYFNLAEYEKAKQCFEEAYQIAKELGISLLAAHFNLAEIALLQGKQAQLQIMIDEGLQFSNDIGDLHAQALYLRLRGVSERLQGNLQEAEALMQQAEQIHRRRHANWFIGETERDLGDIAVQRLLWKYAEEKYSGGIRSCRQSNNIDLMAHLYACRAALRSVDDRYEDAIADLTCAVTQLDHRHRPMTRVEILEMAALVFAPKDQRLAATFLLTSSTHRQKWNTPTLSPFAEQLVALATSLHRIMHAFRSVPSIGEAWSLLEESLQIPKSSQEQSVQAKVISPQIQVYGLGTPMVYVAGNAVRDTSWVYHKAQELFFYLMERTKVTKERIALDLWSDASPEQFRNSFHRCIHFIRKALGDNACIEFDGKFYSVNQNLSWYYDVANYEEHVRKAAEFGSSILLNPERLEEQKTFLQNAVRLWRGEFLQGMDYGEWAIFRREELIQTHLQALIDLGQILFIKADYLAAKETFERVLGIDPFLEKAHRERMRCLSRLGERTQAIRSYNQLVVFLADELNVTPSKETIILYERLCRGDEI